MDEGPVVVIIRGLKVKIRVLDEFFYDNGCHTTSGYPPFYEEDPDEWSTLLRSRLGGNSKSTRLFIPARKDHDQSKFGYIAWTYEMVYAQKEVCLPEDLPIDPPEGWDSLKNEILSFGTSKDNRISEESGHGKTGVFIVVCEERSYTPPSIAQRVGEYIKLRYYFELLTEHNTSLLTATNAIPYWTHGSIAKNIALLSTDRRKD